MYKRLDFRFLPVTSSSHRISNLSHIYVFLLLDKVESLQPYFTCLHMQVIANDSVIYNEIRTGFKCTVRLKGALTHVSVNATEKPKELLFAIA